MTIGRNPSHCNISKLVVVGFAALRYHNGKWLGRDQIVNYIHDLSENFDKVVLVTNTVDPTSTIDTDSYTTPLDTEQVTPIVIDMGDLSSIFHGVREMAAFADKHTGAIIQTPYTPALLFAPILRVKVANLVGYMANNPSEVAERRADSDGIREWLMSYATRANGRLIYALSDHLLVRGKKKKYKEHHNSVFESKPIISLPEIEREDLETKKRDSATELLYVGTLTRRKGIRVLIDALEVLHHECNTDIRLKIIGEGPLKDELVDAVDSARINNIVTFIPWLDDMKTLASHYLQADILVVPSRDTEGSPRVIDEANYYNTAVIASNIEYHESIEPGENISAFEPEEVGELVDRIFDLVTNEEALMRLKGKGKQRINELLAIRAAEQHTNIVQGASIQNTS